LLKKQVFFGRSEIKYCYEWQGLILQLHIDMTESIFSPEAVMKYFLKEFEMSVAEKSKIMEKYGYIAKEEHEDALKKMDDELKKKDDELKKKDDEMMRMRMLLENAGLLDKLEMQ
jgi:ElaB/YqjD/DUF883 family membrane-anchored ribosome-binding protein